MEGRPRGQGAVKERKLYHPKYYKRRERCRKVVPVEIVRN